MNESAIRCIVGLGNPGPKYRLTRHNIGFLVLDALAEAHGGVWKNAPDALVSEISINGTSLLLIKPQTGMNISGRVYGALRTRGIRAHSMLIVHDELEVAFGKMMIRQGGSARGHNGLRSFIEHAGIDFYRLRVGIGRPQRKEDVPDYVLSGFSEGSNAVSEVIDAAVVQIEDFVQKTSVSI